MTATQLNAKLATLAVLVVAISALVPTASACTPGSLLCAADAPVDQAFTAAGTAQAAVFAAPSSVTGALPTVWAAEQQVLDEEKAARDSALASASGGIDAALAAADGAHGTAMAGLSAAAATSVAAVNGAGDVGDASLTDGLLLAGEAEALATAARTQTQAFVADTADAVPGILQQATDPAIAEVDDIKDEDIPALQGQVGGIVGGLSTDPVLDAYGVAKGALVGMVDHNYGLLHDRFPALLPAPADVDAALSNLP